MTDHDNRTEESITVGPFAVTYAVPDSPFTIGTEVRKTAAQGLYEFAVQFSSMVPAVLPPMAFTWSHPMKNCHLKWDTKVAGAT